MNLPQILFVPIVPLILNFSVADRSLKQGLCPFPKLPKPSNVNSFLFSFSPRLESTFLCQINFTDLLEKKEDMKNIS